MDKLPYLPELESARAREIAGPWDMVWLAGISAVVVVALVVSWFFTDLFRLDSPLSQLYLVTLIVSIMLVFHSWLLVRWSFYSSWETGTEGLAFRGPLRMRLVRWSEIESAEFPQRVVRSGDERRIGDRCILRTAHGSMSVPTHEPVFAASLWQHLQSNGKAGDIQLPRETNPLWEAIAGESPAEMEWTNPQPPNVAFIWLKIAGFVALCVLLLVSKPHFWLPSAVLAWALLESILVGRSVRTVCVVRRLCVREDGVEADTTCGHVSSPWASLERAFWRQGALELVPHSGRQLEIPANGRPPELVRTIRQHLRAQKPPVLLPEKDTGLPSGCLPVR